MEKAILRRDMISMKGRVSKAKKAPDLTEAGLKKAVAELKRVPAIFHRNPHAATARGLEVNVTLAAGEHMVLSDYGARRLDWRLLEKLVRQRLSESQPQQHAVSRGDTGVRIV